jgi:hypothetical protein
LIGGFKPTMRSNGTGHTEAAIADVCDVQAIAVEVRREPIIFQAVSIL